MSLTNSKLVTLKDQIADEERALKAELEAVVKDKNRAAKKK